MGQRTRRLEDVYIPAQIDNLAIDSSSRLKGISCHALDARCVVSNCSRAERLFFKILARTSLPTPVFQTSRDRSCVSAAACMPPFWEIDRWRCPDSSVVSYQKTPKTLMILSSCRKKYAMSSWWSDGLQMRVMELSRRTR